MKNKLILTSLLLFTSLYWGIAQTNLKIGHVNIPELVQNHSSTDSIQKVLETETKEMEKIYGEMIGEHEAKLKTFEKEQAGYSEFVKKTKQEELVEIAQKIQTYNQNAQQQLQKRNMELVQPIYEKINAAIKRVADRDGFTYILDISNGTVAYTSPESINITALVKKELEM